MFKTNFGQFDESNEHIGRCETILGELEGLLSGLEGGMAVQRAILDRTGPLREGLNSIAKSLEATIKKGIKIDARRPELAEKATKEAAEKRDKIVEFLEGFKANCGHFAEAEVHIQRPAGMPGAPGRQ
jgi:hypothetical protein